MKCLLAVMAAGIAVCTLNPAQAHDTISLTTKINGSEFHFYIRDFKLNVDCINKCYRNIHFIRELYGSPLGLIRQSKNVNSITILEVTGAYYHAEVIFIKKRKIIVIFNKYSKYIPAFGSDDHGNPTVSMPEIDKHHSFKKSNSPDVDQTWVEHGDHFALLT